MPAVLVEVGFLSNTDEAARLLSPDTQGQIAGFGAHSYTLAVGAAAEMIKAAGHEKEGK